jgi:hypothetical protein
MTMLIKTLAAVAAGTVSVNERDGETMYNTQLLFDAD